MWFHHCHVWPGVWVCCWSPHYVSTDWNPQGSSGFRIYSNVAISTWRQLRVLQRYLATVAIVIDDTNVDNIFTADKGSLRRLCFYTCLSFCPWEGAWSRGGSRLTPKGEVGGVSSRPTPKGEVEGELARPPPMATAVGGTHPTGMHSCCIIITEKESREIWARC